MYNTVCTKNEQRTARDDDESLYVRDLETCTRSSGTRDLSVSNAEFVTVIIARSMYICGYICSFGFVFGTK